MGLPDLLWACPACGLDRGLRASSGEDTCGGCGTRYERVEGARIRALGRGGEARTRSPAAWVDELPAPDALLEASGGRAARVTARFVVGSETIRDEGRYVNRIETFGPAVEGTLELARESLTFRGTGPDTRTWAFVDLRAVQASSRTLQLRGGDHPLASFAFLDDSSFLWERLLAAALAGFYRRTGRGEIMELQPRIVTRDATP